MKHSIFSILLVLIATVSVKAQTVWTLDKGHSSVSFTVTHLAMSEVDGVFKDYEATITSTKEDFSDAVVEATLDLTTVTTNNQGRDGHLQKDDMFDTANHPKLLFKSTKTEKVADKKFKVTGDLTIKGITKEVTLDLTLLGTGENRRSKKPMAGFKLTGEINRTDFNVGNMPGLVVGETVTLRASGEFHSE